MNCEHEKVVRGPYGWQCDYCETAFMPVSDARRTANEMQENFVKAFDRELAKVSPDGIYAEYIGRPIEELRAHKQASSVENTEV